jgi:hypothetical protein
MWNSEYFFTGSDCTYYILLQKIDWYFEFIIKLTIFIILKG